MSRLAISWLLVCAASGFGLETPLLNPGEVRTRVAMALIANFSDIPLPVRTPDFLLTSHESAPTYYGPLFTLQGRDKRGRDWQVILPDPSRFAWRADLGAARTYFFAGYAGGAGLAPGTWMLALSFDDAGRPVPFFFLTQGSYGDKGLDDFLNLDGTGPELLEQSYSGGMRSEPGYWVTTVYQHRGLYWYRSDGSHGTHVFPAFEKWSGKSIQDAELMSEPPAGLLVRDSSNDPASGVRAKVIAATDDRVQVEPPVGCVNIQVHVVVTDSRKGRVIDLQPGTESLNPLVKARRAVVLTGLDRSFCDAQILWALTESAKQ